MQKSRITFCYLDALVAKLFLILAAFLVVANSALAQESDPMALIGQYEGVRASSIPQNVDRYSQSVLKRASVSITGTKDGLLVSTFFSGVDARDKYLGEGFKIVLNGQELSDLFADCGSEGTFESPSGELVILLTDACKLFRVEVVKIDDEDKTAFQDRIVQIRKIR